MSGEIYFDDVELSANPISFDKLTNYKWNGYEIKNITSLKTKTDDSKEAYKVTHAIRYSHGFTWPGLGNFILGLGEVTAGTLITPFCPSVGPTLVGIGIETIISSIKENHKGNHPSSKK